MVNLFLSTLFLGLGDDIPLPVKIVFKRLEESMASQKALSCLGCKNDTIRLEYSHYQV